MPPDGGAQVSSNAEEAVRYYASVFECSRIVVELRCGDSGPGPKGAILTVEFELEGQRFVALNGGPHFSASRVCQRCHRCQRAPSVAWPWQIGWVCGEDPARSRLHPRAARRVLRRGRENANTRTREHANRQTPDAERKAGDCDSPRERRADGSTRFNLRSKEWI
ncbi:VOC family protein [Sorangium sp. So ce341]|uniref:VOC family protein n=1 Tax=Sorangium sp. So ce341 TaxID=3133302 RepID=UPI003F638573